MLHLHGETLTFLKECDQIFSNQKDARSAARRLLQILYEQMEIRSIEFHYKNPQTGYEWKERLPGNGSNPNQITMLHHPPITWGFSFYTNPGESFHQLLILVSRRWLEVYEAPKPSQSSFSRNYFHYHHIQRISHFSSPQFQHDIQKHAIKRSPLLILGEPGTGRHFIAEILQSLSPFPEIPHRIIENPIEIMEENHTIASHWNQDTQRWVGIGDTNLPTTLVQWKILFPHHDDVLRIPPLRNRQADFPQLVKHILDELCQTSCRAIPQISQAVWKLLIQYSWPRNVLELRETLETALQNSPENSIEMKGLPSHLLHPQKAANGCKAPTLEELEINALRASYFRWQGKTSSCARELGISERQLRYRLKKYALFDEDESQLPR
ncbi:MAG: hypothetical protein MI717_06075 [Spirochaetales bacterium]|nr:hypothetical protein [Spirochaetales bacterium]